ncbi:ribonucleoside-diphosphate reductase subunit alpha [Amycolatopsis antarctica]|uniref:Ribonucleoside-diphosphate reductase n=1 Tax=Amycolatopsis antarctica TaxID=1854586 RepID=A0A263D1K2_9PSEU|nr:ribonucleoside-diphosphate reductase subunit alpha [Amycolatopsis antarctica]OZM72333.1 ribonucleoside-diphosphate reductase subunit alpha [Amycolatopsis antarctica]
MSTEAAQRPPSTADTAATTVRVIRRDGAVSPFDASKISVAMTKAFLAVEGGDAAASSRIHHLVADLTGQVESSLLRHAGPDTALHIEQIQDLVELVLMRGEHHKVARAYVLYRDERAKARQVAAPTKAEASINVRAADGVLRPLDWGRVAHVVGEAVAGLDDVAAEPVLTEARRNLYDGITADELALAQIMAARTLVEQEPNYSYVSARLLLDKLRGEALTYLAGSPTLASQNEMAHRYGGYFRDYLTRAIELELVDPELATFDLGRITAAIMPERDLDFGFLGLQTLYDRYFQHHDGVRFELPQAFFMRVAMGLAIREDDRESRAIEFYELLSSFHFMASTPTLFNSGTTRPQLSSCFLTTVDDDLDSIFQAYKNNALLAKYSGGLGNDWTPVRGLGAHIKGTNGQSQGVVPFLKIANDTAVAVNQGGKRKGAACAYLETWHVDIEEFLDLRKNTGDDRRRTHDMNTANWVPDEFLRRVESDASWTLFSPNEVPDLHDLYGNAFAERYREYEAAAERGEIKVSRRVRAVDLWRRMLTMLFETGHPWITFKDPCNLRSPQQHVGVVHSSNLCTEITLNTDAEEVAVCNLGSVNLLKHVTPDGLDTERLERTVGTAVRMLDNVIDINFYTIPEASRSNLRHRPVGLGLMGFQDALFELGLPLSSDAAVTFADTSMEHISYYAITASSALAAERGRYESFEGSLWSKGILPIDSMQLLIDARSGDALDVDTSSTLDWDTLRETVRTQGMRNSNVMAIAPTATISNICGVGQSIEPLFQNLFVKSNMSGDFTVINPHLVTSLKEHGLWDEVMVSDLKYFDGSLGQIDRVPADLKALYATAFEVESKWLVDAASRRQKWIDQAQSLNLYIDSPSGRKLDELYRYAWHKGLKTTYYLRARSATHVEKSTLRGTDGKLNAVSATPAAAAAPPAAAPAPTASGSPSPSPTAAVPAATAPDAVPPATPPVAERPGPKAEDVDFTATDGAACRIDDPDCEACQ